MRATNGTLSRMSLAGISLGWTVIALGQTVSITEYPTPTTASSEPAGITLGPDGALWFTETLGNKIGRISTSGVSTDYLLPIANSYPEGITAGPDGALWFTAGANIGRITIAGAITEYAIPSGQGGAGITAGPDGALWFTEDYGNQIGRITTTGVVTEYPVPLPGMTPNKGGFANGSVPLAITTGPDGALWFTDMIAIGRITTSGTFTMYPAISSNGITTGPDGALWFTEYNGADGIGRITTSGAITSYPLPVGNGNNSIAVGPDGALWFTEFDGTGIGRITTSGAASEYPVPTANSSPGGIVAGPDGALWFTERTGNHVGRAVVVQANTFLPWEQSATPVQNYWQFADGNPFGYYSVLEISDSSQTALIDHADLGYEYVQAGSTSGSLYLYDFASEHWWYTSSSLFPYLYDFTLNAWIYYFPNTQSAGHYAANPRDFANMTTGDIFTM